MKTIFLFFLTIYIGYYLFRPVTKKIVEIANIHSKGRVISFLEGGYDLTALSESIREHLIALKPHI